MRALSILLCLLLMAAPSLAAEKTRIGVTINCNEPDARNRLAAAFTKAFNKAPDYELSDSLPQARLLIYANRDTNSAKNAQGWSIAFARVSNAQSYYAASKLANTQQSDALAVKQVVGGMVNEAGFLKSLNVAHLDELSDATADALAEVVTAAFIKEMR
jgi:hypothetical protein